MSVEALKVVSTASRMMANNSKFVKFGNRKSISEREITKVKAINNVTRIELPQVRKSFVEVTPSKRASVVRRSNVENAAKLM